MDKHDASVPALLEGSQLTTKGRADVFRQRERTKRKKLIRAIVVVLLVDAYLYHRVATDHPFQLPTIGSEWIIFAPAILLIFAVLLMVALPLMNGKSPHVTIQPEQVEVGLTQVCGLDTQVEEVVRSLDMFLGYATFRDELGGTPRRGILFEGPPGTGKTYLAKAMSKQAGVPFMFIAAPALQSMWFGMTAFRIRSFFKALRKAARKEGGAIGFIEEIDAIGVSRDSMSAMTPRPRVPRADPLDDDVVRHRGHGERAVDPDAVLRPAAVPRSCTREVRRLGQRVPAQRPSAEDGEVPVSQHPVDRGHQPRRLPRPGAAAPRSLRPSPLLRRAEQERAGRAHRLLPGPQEAPRAARRSR